MKHNWYKLWRCIIANIMYLCAPQKTKKAVTSDFNGYLASTDYREMNIRSLNNLLLSGNRAFRNVFYYRFRHHRLLCSFSRLFLPDIQVIELYGNIGEGLYVSPNYMVVHPEKTGENFRVDAGVVVGKNAGKYPFIGDNVSIGANSTVIGGIHIGDNVKIEAGSVVTKDIPANTVYGGNPAQFVRFIQEESMQSQEM